MNVEEARKMVDELMQQAQQQPPVKPEEKASPTEPRRIEILSDDEGLASTDNQNVEALRQQVQAMQEELRRLKRK
jgi:polyhydroxyalkanoate synthesis regulator phasin